MFRQIELSLNNTQINDLSTPTYAYKAYLENHLTYDDDMKNSTLEACELYVKGTSGESESYTTANGNGCVTRRAKVIPNKKVFFSLLLHVDFFHCKKFLLPGVDMKLRFIRNDDSFSLIAPATNTTRYKIKFNKMYLTIRRITLDPLISSAIEQSLSSTPAIYNHVQSKMKTYLINQGIQQQHISQIIRGKLPRSIIISFVTAKAFDGDIANNPFCFKHFNINYLNVMINGEPIVPSVFQPDFANDNYIYEYRWFLDNIGLHNEMSNGITFSEYKNGSCFFPFDLSPDLCNSTSFHGSLQGGLDIHVGFSTPLSENIVCVIYASYDENVLIDKDRNVSIVS